MSYKVYRGHSNESGTFDQDGSVCNIDTQQSMGVIDWTKSYVLFHHELAISNNPATVHNIVLQNPTAYLPSEAIVKRYRKQFDRAGVVCDVKDINSFSSNLKQFSYDNKQKEIEFHPMTQKDNTGASALFTRKNNIGTINSTYERYPLKVMLKDLDGFNAVANSCDLSKFGNCRDFFELNKNIFTPTEIIRFGDAYYDGLTMPNYTNNTGGNINFGSDVPLTIQKFSVTPDMFQVGGSINVHYNNNGGGATIIELTIATIDDSGADELIITTTAPATQVANGTSVTDIIIYPFVFDVYANGTGGNVNLNQLTYTREVDQSEIPFYVGQGIRMQGFNDTTPFTSTPLRITSISYDNTTRKATLTFSGTIATVADQTNLYITRMRDTKLSDYGNNPALSTSIVEVEMVLYSRKVSIKGSQQINYVTVQSQRFNMSGNNHQDTFTLEPECFNVMIMQPNSNNLLSDASSLTNYRLRLDGEDLTNRDVTVEINNRQLHNDRLFMTLQNARIPIKTLDSYNPQPERYREAKSDILTHSNNTVYPCNPVPFTERNKMLQVRLQGSGALNNDAILFKQLTRVIKG